MATAAPVSPLPSTTSALATFAPDALNERYERVAVDALQPSPTNPRKAHVLRGLEDLVQSVREKHVLEPLIVRPLFTKKGPRFEIVAGERRWTAACKAGLADVPCVIRDYTDEQALEIQLLENLQRKDLTPLEAAAGFRALIDKAPDRHSAASIAIRTGMSVTWVWETLSLNHLVADAKKLLDREILTRGHAVLIAAQTPEWQKKLIDPDGPVWSEDGHGLDFDAEDADDQARTTDPWYHTRPMSIRQLAQYIDNHVRFDVAHVAKAQPLAFEAIVERVEDAAKTIPITFEYQLPEDARDAQTRTYGVNSWQRADGQPGPGQKKPSALCEHSVLGLVVAGKGRGQAFPVCVARDKCLVHFKESATATLKRKKAAAAPGKKTAAAPPKGPTAAEIKAKAKREADEAAQRIWRELEPKLLAEVYRQLKEFGPEDLTPAMGKRLDEGSTFDHDGLTAIKQTLGKDWYREPAAAICIAHFAGEYNLRSYDQLVTEAKKFALDVKKLAAVRDAAAKATA